MAHRCGHETQPGEELGVPALDQARYAREALGAAVGNPRVRMLVWFVLRDSPGNLAERSHRPRWRAEAGVSHVPRGCEGFSTHATRFFPWDRARHSCLRSSSPIGSPPAHRSRCLCQAAGRSVLPRPDGWLDVPLGDVADDLVEVEAVDVHGNAVERRITLG